MDRCSEPAVGNVPLLHHLYALLGVVGEQWGLRGPFWGIKSSPGYRERVAPEGSVSGPSPERPAMTQLRRETA
jgi:hypothetical protein